MIWAPVSIDIYKTNSRAVYIDILIEMKPSECNVDMILQMSYKEDKFMHNTNQLNIQFKHLYRMSVPGQKVILQRWNGKNFRCPFCRKGDTGYRKNFLNRMTT